MTPTDENASWISSVPPSATRRPQSRMSARAGRVAVGAVDVEHVDRRRATSPWASAENAATWRTRSAHAGAARLALEDARSSAASAA